MSELHTDINIYTDKKATFYYGFLNKEAADEHEDLLSFIEDTTTWITAPGLENRNPGITQIGLYIPPGMEKNTYLVFKAVSMDNEEMIYPDIIDPLSHDINLSFMFNSELRDLSIEVSTYSKKPIAGATVTLYPIPGTPVAKKTDSKGVALFQVNDGRYTMVVEKEEYEKFGEQLLIHESTSRKVMLATETIDVNFNIRYSDGSLMPTFTAKIDFRDKVKRDVIVSFNLSNNGLIKVKRSDLRKSNEIEINIKNETLTFALNTISNDINGIDIDVNTDISNTGTKKNKKAQLPKTAGFSAPAGIFSIIAIGGIIYAIATKKQEE